MAVVRLPVINRLFVAVVLLACLYVYAIACGTTYPTHFGEHKFRSVVYEDARIIITQCWTTGCGARDTFHRRIYERKPKGK